MACGVWLAILAMSFACLRTIHPGLRSEDLVPLAVGGCLLGVGLAMPIVFLQRVCRDSVSCLFGGMLGADVAAASGLAASLLLLTKPLHFLVSGGGVFEGYIVILMPIMGLFFGGVGGCVGSMFVQTRSHRRIAMAVGAGLPLGLVGIPSCHDGGRSEFIWAGVTIMLGIVGTLAGRWLSLSGNAKAAVDA